jgi:dUTP pyrophosphatase
MLNIKIKPESETFKMPIKGSEHAACYDVYADRIEYNPDGYYICYLGFSTEIPNGWKGVIVPRSNITKFGYAMLNSPGQIDSDFRNEWQVRFQAIPIITEATKAWTFNEFPYKVGDRIAQIYFEEENEVNFEKVTNTSDTERGLGGFGSTGHN